MSEGAGAASLISKVQELAARATRLPLPQGAEFHVSGHLGVAPGPTQNHHGRPTQYFGALPSLNVNLQAAQEAARSSLTSSLVGILSKSATGHADGQFSIAGDCES